MFNKPRLVDQVRDAIGKRHYSYRTEKHLATLQFNVGNNGVRDLALIRAHPLPDAR